MINSVGALKVKRKSNATKETSGTYRMQNTHVWKESQLLKFVLTCLRYCPFNVFVNIL